MFCNVETANAFSSSLWSRVSVPSTLRTVLVCPQPGAYSSAQSLDGVAFREMGKKVLEAPVLPVGGSIEVFRG